MVDTGWGPVGAKIIGRFDSNPTPTQIYAFKWTIRNLKTKLENPITRERIEANFVHIKDSKLESNQMTLALLLSFTPDTDGIHSYDRITVSLLKKSMTCQEITICWNVTFESQNAKKNTVKLKLQKDKVALTSKTIKHDGTIYIASIMESPVYHITLYMEVIWPEKSNTSGTVTGNPGQIKIVVVEHMMNGKYTDIKLTCKDKEFNCHKVILAAQSPVFDTMFSNEDNLEMQQGVVDIKDMEPEELETFLKFFYTGRFDDDMKLHAKALLAAADKYDIKDLMALTEEELVKIIDLENIIDMFMLAHLHNAHYLKKKALHFIITNFDKISKQQQWQDLKNGQCDMVELVEIVVEMSIL